MNRGAFDGMVRKGKRLRDDRLFFSHRYLLVFVFWRHARTPPSVQYAIAVFYSSVISHRQVTVFIQLSIQMVTDFANHFSPQAQCDPLVRRHLPCV